MIVSEERDLLWVQDGLLRAGGPSLVSFGVQIIAYYKLVCESRGIAAVFSDWFGPGKLETSITPSL